MPDIVCKFLSINPGFMAGGKMFGGNAKPLLTCTDGSPVRGKITLDLTTIEVQESEDSAPVTYVRLHLEIEGKPRYTIRMPAEVFNDQKRFLESLNASGKLPVGVVAQEGLRDAILALTAAPDRYPVYERDLYAAPGGLYADGHRLCTDVLQIVDERTDSHQGTIYTLKVGEGSKWIEIPFESLQRGDFGYLISERFSV